MTDISIFIIIWQHMCEEATSGRGATKKKADQNKARWSKAVKGAGGLHQDFLEIDFLVVSDREE